MNYRNSLIWLVFLLGGNLYAQNYNAIHGSNYSGALGVYNNPSSIVISPYKWDLTLVGFQYETISNAVKGPNFPFNLSPKATYFMADGNYRRNADFNFNLRLLNGRYAINKKSAIAFGANVRGYSQAQTSRVNYSDSVLGPRSFLFLNQENETLEVDMAGSAWLELYGTYGLTIWNREENRLNAGVTLKILRGMSGVFARANNVGVVREDINDQVVYRIVQGDARYGYSSNHGDGDSFTASDLFKDSKTGFAIDLGIEYLVKSQAVTTIYDEEDENDYEWKIGFSLLDIGWNRYTYSNQSRAVSSLRDDVTSTALQDKFSSITDVSSFNDSLATIVNSFEPLMGDFKIMNPARAVINVDRYVSGNVYVNAELSVNLAPGGKNTYAVKESKLITITPRWESRKLGFYMPVQFNRHTNFRVGAAIKAGPLLLGTHNLLNTFSRNKYLSSGAYIALTIRPFQLSGEGRNRQYDCPAY